MSKAFTKEPESGDVYDDLPDRPISRHNLVTPKGLELIEAELARLHEDHVAAHDADDKPLLAKINRDLRYWTSRRATAQVVQPPVDIAEVHFGSTVTIELRATYDTPLVAAKLVLSASGEPDAVLSARSADPVTPAGLTFISTTSQEPFVSGLPHDLKAAPTTEVLLDLDFDAQPGGPTDGMAPGADLLLETLEVVVSGTGLLTLSLGEVSAAHTDSAPGGQLFDNATVDPQAAAVTIRLPTPGDIDLDGSVDLADFATFALCFGGCDATNPPPGCSPAEFLGSDLDGDGCVDLADFATFAFHYGL